MRILNRTMRRDVGGLKRFAEDIWTANGPSVPFGFVSLPTRMIAVKLGDGSLWISSRADHADRYRDEFEHLSEFANYRNRLGGLLLLPKSFNASYGDLPYAEKRQHYLTQNLLARSLHEQCYEHRPGFIRFVKESGLPFRAHPEFKHAECYERQTLYRRLAEQIWSPSIW